MGPGRGYWDQPGPITIIFCKEALCTSWLRSCPLKGTPSAHYGTYPLCALPDAEDTLHPSPPPQVLPKLFPLQRCPCCTPLQPVATRATIPTAPRCDGDFTGCSEPAQGGVAAVGLAGAYTYHSVTSDRGWIC